MGTLTFSIEKVILNYIVKLLTKWRGTDRMDQLQEENLPSIDSKQDALQEYLLHLPLPNTAFS